MSRTGSFRHCTAATSKSNKDNNNQKTNERNSKIMKNNSQPLQNHARQVLDCGSPLPLSKISCRLITDVATQPKRQRTGALQKLALVAALALLSHASFAQTWQTVDDFQYVPGYRSWNEGLVVAPSGTLFASGFADTPTNCLELVFASQDSGATWLGPMDQFVSSSAPALGGAPIVCDPSGTLYVVAKAQTPSASAVEWIVRRGTDGGSNWTTVDDCTFVGSNNGSSFSPSGITADALGNVYVAGVVAYSNGSSCWTVRKGIGGTNWLTVDSFSPNGSGWAEAVFAHPTAGVFAVGRANNSFLTGKNNKSTSIVTSWTVRRSLDGGTNWVTVDAFLPLSGISWAYAIGADASGNVYVVGRADTPYGRSSYANWVVRKSADGGNTWATVDDFQLCSTCPAHATGFVADANGNLFVAGQANNSSGALTWIVRENPGGNGGWGISDNFPTGNTPLAITADGLGHVFVGGFDNSIYWTVRRK